jgi:hypothetical protein
VEYKNEFSESSVDLTGAADDLLTLGHMDAYTLTREEILALSKKLQSENCK